MPGPLHGIYSNPSPDGRKKAYVRLTADFDALEIANKVGRSLGAFESFH